MRPGAYTSPVRPILAACLVLAACSEAAVPPKDAPRRAQVDITAKPDVRVHRFDDGELRVLEMPVHVTRGGFVERQTCFLWRDLEYRTTSLQCPAGIEGAPERGQ
jgi:hypothetical protein